MTDLHTHILPGLDDGARQVEESLELLREQARQGVDTVALTPHFYRDRETPRHFLQRRAEAAEKLEAAVAALPGPERGALPRRVLSAEVAWVPNLTEWPELEQLCYAGTKYLLLELPVQRWDRFLFDQIYAIPQLTGLVPVIAHLERYFVGQSRNNLETLCSMGFPVQISGRALLRLSGRARALGALRDGKAQLLISDCHSMASRPPDLAPAMRVIERRLGREAAARLTALTDELLT